MKYSKANELSMAVLITEQSSKNIHSFLNKNFSEIQYSGELSDSTNIIFDNFEDFLNYPNSNSKYISRLSIDCSDGESSYESRRSVSITFRNYRLYAPKAVKYSLKYRDKEWGFLFEDELINELKETRPSYNLLEYFDTYVLLTIITTVYLVYEGFRNLLLRVKSPSGSLFDVPFPVLVTVALIVLIIYFAILWSLNKTRNYLFPVLFFAIGHQVKSFERRRFIANIVFAGIIGAVLLGLFTNYLYDQIK